DEAAQTTSVEAELDNLRAASTWAVAGGDVDLAMRLVAPLTLNGTRIGYITGGWAAAAVATPGASTHPLYPEVLAWSGWAATIAGNLERGVQICRDAVAAADALGSDDRALCAV